MAVVPSSSSSAWDSAAHWRRLLFELLRRTSRCRKRRRSAWATWSKDTGIDPNASFPQCPRRWRRTFAPPISPAAIGSNLNKDPSRPLPEQAAVTKSSKTEFSWGCFKEKETRYYYILVRLRSFLPRVFWGFGGTALFWYRERICSIGFPLSRHT